MRVICLCMMMGLLMAGCTTTGKVDQMIDSKVSPQFEQINAQLEAQAMAAATTLEDMKGFVDRLGNALDKDINDLQSGVDGLKSQLATAKTDVGGAKSDIKGVEADVSELDASVKSISDSVDSMKDAVETLKTQTADAMAAADAATKTAARAISGSK